MSNAIVRSGEFSIIAADQIRQQVNEIQRLQKSVMKADVHFGKIPGCGDKPTLLQPGAQKLCLMFMFADDYDIQQIDMPNGHREYRVKCKLTHKGNGIVQGNGIGICSTMESKYRYRTGPVEFTGKPVPREYWDGGRDQKMIGGKGHVAKKNPETGLWEIAKQGDKIENPDIADTYNTVLKIACKRALVHATLNATAASDIFAQDLEDLPESQPQANQPAQPPDPFSEYKEALTVAKRDRGVNIHEAIAKVEEAIGKKSTDFTQADVAEAVLIVEGMNQEEADPVLEAEDIGF